MDLGADIAIATGLVLLLFWIPFCPPLLYAHLLSSLGSPFALLSPVPFCRLHCLLNFISLTTCWPFPDPLYLTLSLCLFFFPHLFHFLYLFLLFLFPSQLHLLFFSPVGPTHLLPLFYKYSFPLIFLFLLNICPLFPCWPYGNL